VSKVAGKGGRSLKTGEWVADNLRRRIASGDLVSGDRLLAEDELMEHFGIARTTLREGLRILESQGLLAIRRGRGGGPQVTMPSLDRLAQGLALHLQLAGTTYGDLDNARQLIEPALVADLASHHTDEELAAIDAAIDAADDAARRVDLRDFGVAAAMVHNTIAERAHNHTLSTIARLLHQLVEQYYLQIAQRATEAELRRAVRSYRKLLRLLEDGKAEEAAEHWRKQMTYSITESGDRHRRLDLFPVQD
jgi:GntR family transcriptional repressor for pyruvate dehydrogenase complex